MESKDNKELRGQSFQAVRELNRLLVTFEQMHQIGDATGDWLQAQGATRKLLAWFSTHSLLAHLTVLMSTDNSELVSAARECLEMLKHYGPESPGHSCGPESECDMLCVEHANFSDNIVRLTKVVESCAVGESETIKKADAMYKAAGELVSMLYKHYPNIREAGIKELIKMPALDAKMTEYGKVRGISLDEILKGGKSG